MMGETFLSVLSLLLLNAFFYCGHAQDAMLTLQPNLSHFFAGESVTFTCDMGESNATDWLYKFIWNDQQIAPFSNSNSHSCYMMTNMSGDYQCTGLHKGSVNIIKESNTINLPVSAQRPTATVTAYQTTIPEGGSVRLTCSVQDSDGWKYDWFRRTPDSSVETIEINRTENSIRISNEGIYWCRARRGSPVFFTNHSDVYHIEKTLPNRTYVTLQLNWTRIFSGEVITVRCEIQGGGNTEWEYEWRTTSMKTPPTVNNSEYSISSTSVSHNGEYWCKGRRDLYASTDWSNAFTLRVYEKPRATIMADKKTIPAGGNVTLTCYVVNSGEWEYYWVRHASSFLDIHMHTKPDYIITQGGMYHCKGGRGNPIYFTEESDVITIEKRVSHKAFVSLQPNWPLVYPGEMVTVGCEINGIHNTEWEYEWSKPSSNTAPTCNRHIIINASMSSNGSYRCMGKHKQDLYSVTEWSDVMTLTVSALRPKANIGADSTAFLVGDSVALTCSVKPSTGWRYYWYKGRKLLAPLKRQEFVFHSDGVISVSQEGVYWCRGGRGNPVFYSEYSDSVKINKIDITRPVVTLQPNWSEVYSGEAVTLKCEIPGGDSEWIYEWASTSPNKPPNHNKYRIASVSGLYTGSYWCRGRMRIAREISTNWSAPFNLEMSYASPTPVISVSPSWLSPGVPVTLKCETPNPSAGWKFYWYEAVPQLPSMYFHYRSHQRFWHREHHDQALYKYKLLSGSSSGTEQNLYVIHGQKHTAGFACRAGRGDPGFYTDYSKPLFVWSADFYSPASLSASPNRVQHFTGDSVSLKCEGNFTAWRVKMSPDYRAHFSQRHNLWKITSSTCKIDSHYAHNAVYWCESESGEISNTINITLHNGGVILESPVHPVSEGDSVTLSCKWRPGVIGSTVGFYKNSKLIQNDDRLELNISAVSKSDEGFYKCQYAVYESPESWISVKAYDSSFSVSMIVGMVCGFLLILLLILLLFSWYRKSKHVFCARCSQSQRTTDTVQSVNREENQRQLYSSLLHGDVCVYESIRQGENSRIGDPSADYGNVTSQIQLRDVVQKRPSRGLKCQ